MRENKKSPVSIKYASMKTRCLVQSLNKSSAWIPGGRESTNSTINLERAFSFPVLRGQVSWCFPLCSQQICEPQLPLAGGGNCTIPNHLNALEAHTIAGCTHKEKATVSSPSKSVPWYPSWIESNFPSFPVDMVRVFCLGYIGFVPLSSYNFVQPCVYSKATDFWQWGAKKSHWLLPCYFPHPRSGLSVFFSSLAS